MNRVDVIGVPVDPVTVDQLHERILAFIRTGKRATVLHANVHAINLAWKHAWFAQILREADLVFCDGAGVRLGARLLGQQLPARITYADWMWRLAGWCASQRLSLYLVGGEQGVAAIASDRLRTRHPGVTIAGTHHGYFDKAHGGPATRAVLEAINAVRPDIVVVGFGMPLQEQWVHDNRARIDAPVVLTAGAAFDYVSGRLHRAPAWMTEHGLEWLGRLIIEPRRLMARYVIGNPLFLARVLRARLRQSVDRRRLR